MTDPKPVTRTLLIEIRDPNAGVVEVYSPSDEELLSLGYERIKTTEPELAPTVASNGSHQEPSE